MRCSRQSLAERYLTALADIDQIELPPVPRDRIHSWHLFPIRLRLDRLSIDRNAFITSLRERGVGCSVHWRPLHLHPYYAEQFGWQAGHLPQATAVWPRLVSLPLFPDMQPDEHDHVVRVVHEICAEHASEK
jgi:perosamine synthetase